MNYKICTTLNEITKNAIKNYGRRPADTAIASKAELRIAQGYIQLYTNYEQEYEWCYEQLTGLVPDLAEYLKSVHQNYIEINVTSCFTELVTELIEINAKLEYEETVNYGFGPNAKKLRKEWRKTIRKLRKYLRKSVTNKINYIKEWSKPKTVYVLNGTGEVHNGLYWAMRELLINPRLIIYGFKKEN